MHDFIHNAGLTILVLVELIMMLILLSYLLFGGKFEVRISVNGPLKFLSHATKDGDKSNG